MHSRSVAAAALLTATLLAPTAAFAAEPAHDGDRLLLGNAYPLEVRVVFHAALFHWVDSLAGTSGGKTVPAHQREFRNRFGELGPRDQNLLLLFRDARRRDAYRPAGDSEHGVSGHRGMAPLRLTFLESDGLDDALRRAEKLLEPADFVAVRETLLHFRPRYDAIWQDGRIPMRFLDRCRDDPARKELESLLARVAGFYGADLDAAPRPVVVLAPVPSGYGTHATAVGPYLLIEVRPADRLRHQAAVIVHENAHFLFAHMDPTARARLERRVRDSSGLRSAWGTLEEALPTALGQGVADRSFRRSTWSKANPWYHREAVDAYAKALYPLVRDTLDRGEPFDVGFLEKAAALEPE